MNKYELNRTTLGLAIGAALVAGNAQAATITVNTLADTDDAGLCSLRSAIASANQGQAVAGCAAGSNVQDEIVFDGALSGTSELSAPLIVTNSLAINGPGADRVTLRAADNQRVFDVDFSIHAYQDLAVSSISIAGNGQVVGGGGAIRMVVPGFGHRASLKLADVSISNAMTYGGNGGAVAFYTDHCGGLTIDGGRFESNTTVKHSGGAIYAGSYYDCPVVLRDTVIRSNVADGGGGGGVFVAGGHHTPRLQLIGSTLENNVSLGRGGGLYVSVRGHASVEVADTAFRNNRAYGYGGGMALGGESPSAELSLARSEFSGNSSTYDGGGLFVAIGSNTEPGRVEIDEVDFIENETPYNGGGALLEVRNSEVSIGGSRLLGNTADYDGGGMWIRGRDSDLTISNTEFGENRAAVAGGLRAYMSSGDVLVRNSRFSGNVAEVFDGGGAEFVFGRSLVIDGSVFSSNRAASAGGLNIYGTESAVIRRSQFSHNIAEGSDYGYGYAGAGGGLMVVASPAEVENSTFSYNEADLGGAIAAACEEAYRAGYGDDCGLRLNHVTITHNRSGGAGALYALELDCTAKNSIIAQNPPAEGNGVGVDLTGGCQVSHSLIGNSAGSEFVDGGGNLFDVVPLIGPLAVNGNRSNPTLTHALLPGSPAIDAGDPGDPGEPATDQRGLPRVFGGRRDMGAFEAVSDTIFADRFQGRPRK